VESSSRPGCLSLEKIALRIRIRVVPVNVGGGDRSFGSQPIICVAVYLVINPLYKLHIGPQ